jgi:filamentous hemagglutinin family protein
VTDWGSFSIGAGNTVNIVQPDSSAISLNRVMGSDVSSIQGALNANGKVFLINPNGIIFTKTSQVNVGGLVASTLNMATSDFMSGKFSFSGKSAAAITSEGNIVAVDNGKGALVAMIAAKIVNQGTISAERGKVVLASGSQVLLNLGGSVELQVEQGALDALIENGGAIKADGGSILLTAEAVGDLSGSVINNQGIIEAQTLATGEKGEIILKGGMENNSIRVGGRLDASAPQGGDGGFIETSAAHVQFDDRLVVTTLAPLGKVGTWLIDPDFIHIIAGSGGSVSGLPSTGLSEIGVNTLNTALTSSNVNLQANQEIDFQVAFNYTGTRDAVLGLYAPVIKLGADISSATNKLGLNFGGTYSSTNYAGNVYVFNGNRVISTKGGDVHFNGNIGGGLGVNGNLSGPYNLTVNTSGGSITHASAVNGTFDVINNFTGSVNFGFSSHPKEMIVLDFVNGVVTRDGSPTPITSGVMPRGVVSFVAGTEIELNAKGPHAQVTFTKPDNSTVTLTANPGGHIIVPTGGLSCIKIEYEVQSAAGVCVPSGNVTYGVVENAGKINNYIANAGAGSVTLDSGASIAVNGNIEIATALFDNNAGSSALVPGTSKYWRVWSRNLNPFNVSTGDDAGGLTPNFKQYNATYGSSTVLGTGNGLLYTIAPQVTISLINTISKTYNGNTSATNLLSSNYAVSSGVGGDTVSLAGTLPTSGTYASKNVNTGIGVTVTGLSTSNISAVNGSATVYGYGLTSTSATGNIGTITKANITAITGITANNKPYDQTDAATLVTSGAGFTGKISGDVLTVATATGHFDTPNVGVGKTVNITGLSLGGTDAGNYNLTNTTATTTANITAALISAITGITADNKVYNASTNATLVTTGGGIGFTGILSGDVLTVATATGNFTDKNVGNGKTVNITGLTLGGASAGNYTLSTNTATTTANITKADIAAITGITANNKVYDGNTDATLVTTGAAFTGKFSGDSLSVGSSTGTFDTKDVGVGKTVSITGLTLAGTDAGNYNLTNTTATTTANITKASITAITGITANDKVYDSTRDATLDTSTPGFTGIISGDTLTVATATGLFDTKNVGTGKTVNISGLTLGGASVGNYTLTNDTATTTASITKADISSISGITADNKPYDGNTMANLVTSGAIFNGMFSGDVLNVATGTGAFDTKDAATGKTVSISGLSLGGTDAGNYNLISTAASTTADITKLSLLVEAKSTTKVYDGLAYSGGAGLNYSGFLAGEDESVLVGPVVYGGTSQGAIATGLYSIIPSGLTATNYAITYLNGQLNIYEGPPVIETPVDPNNFVRPANLLQIEEPAVFGATQMTQPGFFEYFGGSFIPEGESRSPSQPSLLREEATEPNKEKRDSVKEGEETPAPNKVTQR